MSSAAGYNLPRQSGRSLQLEAFITAISAFSIARQSGQSAGWLSAYLSVCTYWSISARANNLNNFHVSSFCFLSLVCVFFCFVF